MFRKIRPPFVVSWFVRAMTKQLSGILNLRHQRQICPKRQKYLYGVINYAVLPGENLVVSRVILDKLDQLTDHKRIKYGLQFP